MANGRSSVAVAHALPREGPDQVVHVATQARRAAISLAIFACAAMATGAGQGSRLRSRGTSASAISYRDAAAAQVVAAPVPTSPATTATSSAAPSTSSTGPSGSTTAEAVTARFSALDLVGGLASRSAVHASAVAPVSASATQAPATTAPTATTVITTSSTSDKAKPPSTPAFPPLTGGNPPPPPPPTPLPARFGFDICEAPSVEAMAAWRAASPYSVIGIYIGGPSRNCSNVALRTPAWLNAVKQQGWTVIPTYVGPQAPCSDFRSRMYPAQYFAQGMGAADEAIAQSKAAGLADGSAIYLDMEAYPAGNPVCDAAVRDFVAGWSRRMRGLGWVPGVYGSLFSAISNANATKHASTPDGPDAVWVAAWSGLGNILGFQPSALSDDVWSSHARIHQYAGDHTETWGGVTMRIDSDVVDGPVGK